MITEFYHIGAKSYHYVLADKSTKFKHKGVSKKGIGKMASETYFPTLGGSLFDKPVDKTEIFDPMTQVYYDCLFENKVFYAKNIGIRSKDHILSLVNSEKKALCPIDTKRWILSDGVTSLLYNHWRIRVYKNMVKDNISNKEAEKRAIKVKLLEKYQNTCISHIASSLP